MFKIMKEKRKYNSQLRILYIKKYLKDIPKIVGMSLIAAIISILAYTFIARVYGGKIDEIKIAYVSDAEDDFLEDAFDYIRRTVDCEFENYNQEEAFEALEAKDVAAIFIVNEEFDNEDNIARYHARLVYPESEDFVTELFGGMLSSGLKDFMILKTAPRIAAKKYTIDTKDNIIELRDFLMKLLIDRNINYNRVTYSDSGELPLKHFYMGNGIVLLLLLSLSVVTGFMKNEDEHFVKSLNRININAFDVYIARYLPMISIYQIVVLVGLLAYQIGYLGRINFINLLAGMLATVVITTFVFFIHELISDKILGTLVSIALTLSFMFLSGNVVPLSVLPENIRIISDYFFTKWVVQIYGQILYGGIKYKPIFILLIIQIIIAGLQFINIKLRKSK